MTRVPKALRAQVFQRAENRCEYCRVDGEDVYLPLEVDHIYAEKHGGETTADNLCISSFECNRHKGSDLTAFDPVTGEIVALFHPRRDL